MHKGFWETLPKPFFVLAPMADVTDAAFRRLIAKYGKPDVMFTEFTSADGLMLADKRGRETLMKDLLFTDAERPIVAQFFTSRPNTMRKAASLAAKLGFDGVDINMGCPDRSVEKQGAGAVLIKTPELTQELIQEAKRGAGELPVSVKTRLGYNKNEIEEWLPTLLETNVAAITIHARTRKEMSKVSAHWDQIKRAVEIRNFFQGRTLENRQRTLIVGNGDVMSIAEARGRVKETGCDGVMLGKAIFGNPMLFSNSRELENRADPNVMAKVLHIMVEHTKLFEKLLGDTKNFAIMKKHYKAYVAGFDGAKELRMELMEARNASAVKKITDNFLKNGTNK